MSRMRILTRVGVRDVDLPAFSDRSTIGGHWHAVQTFLDTGETDELDRYRGVAVANRLLLTDPDEIERRARIGELDVDDIYVDPR
jgi:hypothetical protein